jgi:hypothetical protein
MHLCLLVIQIHRPTRSPANTSPAMCRLRSELLTGGHMKIFEPTLNLRFVERLLSEVEVVNPVTADPKKKIRVLQQAWIDKNGSGEIEWRIVPFVPGE